MNGWAQTVSKELNVPSEDILSLFGASDLHDTNWRVRENWKYGTSVGISGTPQAYINGVYLEDYPIDVKGWTDLFDGLL